MHSVAHEKVLGDEVLHDSGRGPVLEIGEGDGEDLEPELGVRAQRQDLTHPAPLELGYRDEDLLHAQAPRQGGQVPDGAEDASPTEDHALLGAIVIDEPDDLVVCPPERCRSRMSISPAEPAPTIRARTASLRRVSTQSLA